MFREHDCVVLTEDLPAESLCAGAFGAVVHIHANGAAYEVEFFGADRQTLTIATVEHAQLRRAEISDRAARGNRADFDRFLARVPDVPPMSGDELPPGYIPPVRGSS